MHRGCAAPARNADIAYVLETMRHAVQGFARGETWMAMSADRVAVAATTSAQRPPPTHVTTSAAQHGGGATEIDLTTELPNVMLSADMVSANIAVLQRAASAYQSIMAMGTDSQHKRWPDEIDPADPATSLA
jgi:hypothetical protein